MTLLELKKRFSFRLSAPSYIFPADYAANAAALAPFLDEIELLFFESACDSLPSLREIEKLRKLQDAIRPKTRRTNGHRLEAIILDVNRTLRGWFAYFQHSPRFPFVALDGWVRMRLRSILRKRSGRRGRGRGLDHHRWPNSFFADRGLFSMTAAFDAVRQSPPG